MNTAPLINIDSCAIFYNEELCIPNISWRLLPGENWLITGNNGSGKTSFVSALTNKSECRPNQNGTFSNALSSSTSIVSFEEAAFLIEREKKYDDSDFVEGGIDKGRTPRHLIPQSLSSDAIISLCGIEGILNRGLKFLSTGEIRRTLLAAALTKEPSLLILDSPFDGLDSEAVKAVHNLINNLSSSIKKKKENPIQALIIVLDRYTNIPSSITHVLELSDRKILFSGTREDFESQKINKSVIQKTDINQVDLHDILSHDIQKLPQDIRTNEKILVEMKNVTVEWSGNRVIEKLSWTLHAGEHWLIRGPNGSGKTTFLELITGDNPQVFRNNISLFGKRRGSGETIWELKEKMGIVSYRLHVEYRSLGDLSLETVVLSGLHDSIGLYQHCGKEERILAEKWLSLAGFTGKKDLLFRDLSYGEQRALLIARAAIKCPPILILDEPCHGLDDTHRQRTLMLLEKIAESGNSTLLHVTHDPTEVLECEHHILEFKPGQTPMYEITTR